ncbi:nitrilase-related carbon-nitrogen hydrolase [Quadrisphaera oryzae]|uniref:nitrilase-related carbon-nitrogen hydrolase n=1 Tax=Quadrisphaera TaxID=317661 RepID=UPI001645E8E0|nr:nitrilase-related carbon-nitrogen hydrolase [Quadrisphaera sp. RL12-1S]MBC3760821.1 hydrolase [Quadrisphaera sp. RL12-1S]
MSSTTTTRVAACQLAPTVGDLPANAEVSATAVRTAISAGADVVVLPELVTSGYVFSSPEEARGVAVTPEHGVFAAWAAACTARDGAVVVGGFCELGDDGLLYNSAAVVDASGVRAVYRKAHLWDREKLVFTPGSSAPPVVDTAHGRIAVMVCYDLEFPEWTRTAALPTAERPGADLIAVPTNWPLVPRPAGERVPEVVIAMAAARVNHVAIACADRSGTERGVDWNEGTSIVSADGWVVSEVGAGTGVAWADLDLAASRDKRLTEHAHLLDDRRPELYGAVV